MVSVHTCIQKLHLGYFWHATVTSGHCKSLGGHFARAPKQQLLIVEIYEQAALCSKTAGIPLKTYELK